MQQKDRIKELSQLMRDCGIKVLEVKNQEEEIKIELFPFETEMKTSSYLPDDYEIISAPIMVLGYIKPSDEAQPFVTVGDRVKKGDVVCMIEAMKVMNEIVAKTTAKSMKCALKTAKLLSSDKHCLK